LDFSLWGWLKGEVYRTKVDTCADLVARINNAWVLIKDRRHELRRATLSTLQRVHKCIEVGGGIFENLLWDVPDVDGPGFFPLQIISNTGQCESGNARCIAWSHFEGRTPHLNESAKAAKNNERSSQPIGSLFYGRR